MVSASWSIEGPSAAASYYKDLPIEGGGFNEPSKSVLVFYRDGSSGFAKAMLGHPQPVSMIQWRPTAGKQFLRDAKHSRRHILLTCCLDGTVRLWSEIDSGRVKKAGKDGSYDHKTTKWFFCVAAVIEIDCALRGTLGADIFLTRAMDIFLILLMGHVGGIDCFAVKIFHGEEVDVLCHYICTIPFTGHDPYENGPTNIYSVPLSLSCNETSMCDGFLLLGIWMKEFRALSWEITMHAYELKGSYSECNFNDNDVVECSMRKFENTISGTRYCLHVVPSSVQLPEPHLHDQVTSFAVISPGSLTSMQQKIPFDNDPYSSKSPAYVMATGCSDGSLKLWRCNPYEPSISHTPWELVGMFTAHQGPVSAICLTNCGRKIATIGSDSPSDAVCNLHIWDSIHLADLGTFMLEDALSLDEHVVALNWLALGNGQLLLAVCMHNELRVYAHKRCGGHALLNSKKSLGMQIWFCIGISHTFSAIHDFLWGPRTTGVVVHPSYLSLLSPWLFLLDKKHQTEFYPNFIPESLLDSEIGMDEGTISEIFSDHDVVNHKETLIVNGNGGCKSGLLKKMNTKNGHLSSSFLVGMAQLKLWSKILLGFWSMLAIVETLAGVLPVYHPKALFVNIYSGMSLMLLQVDLSLLLLDIAPMVLMWLYGIHWLCLQPLELPLFTMKVVPAPLQCLAMTSEVVLFLP